MFVTAELNMDLFMINDKTSGTRAGFKTGICIGYQFNPQTAPWQDDSGNYTNMPNTFMEGFYFKLKIGGGGMATKASK